MASVRVGRCLRPAGAQALAFASSVETAGLAIPHQPLQTPSRPGAGPGAVHSLPAAGQSVSGAPWPSCRAAGGCVHQGPWLLPGSPLLCCLWSQEQLFCASGLEGTAPRCCQPPGASPSLLISLATAHASVTVPCVNYPLDSAVCFLPRPCLVHRAHPFP